MTHSSLGHDPVIRKTTRIHLSDTISFICVTRLILQVFWGHDIQHIFWTRLNHMWDMTHSSVWHDSSCRCFGGTISNLSTLPHVGHDALIWGTWLVHLSDITNSAGVWGGTIAKTQSDAFICGTWFIYLWGKISFMFWTRLIHTWNTTHSSGGYVLVCKCWGYDSQYIDTLICGIWRIGFGDITHSSSCAGARGGGLGSRPIFKKFHETYAPS